MLRKVGFTCLFPLLKFTLGPLALYPKNVSTKAKLVTIAMADGEILAISVLQLLLQLHKVYTMDSS